MGLVYIVCWLGVLILISPFDTTWKLWLKLFFETFGKLVAVALLNGCPGPHFFTPMVAGFMLDTPQEPH